MNVSGSKGRSFFLFLLSCVVACVEARTTIDNPRPGELGQVLSPAQIDTCTEIVLTGKLNSADIRLLRRMAGYVGSDGESAGSLRYLDLSGARFVSDKEAYLSVDAEQAHLYIYQKYSYTSNLSDRVQNYSIRGGWMSSNSSVASSGLGGGDSWGYKRNFAVLNVKDDEELYYPSSYRMTGKKKKSVLFHSMRRIKGHHLKKVNGSWQWSSYIRKGRFCVDMFYGCKNLKILIIPGSVKCCSRVSIYKDGIKYFFR